MHILGQGCHGAFPGRNVSLPCLSLLLSFYLTLSSHQYCHPLPFPSIICPLHHHPLHRSPLCCCPVHHRLLCCPSTIAIVPSVDYCTVRQPLRLRPSSRCPSTCAVQQPSCCYLSSHLLTIALTSTMMLLSIAQLSIELWAIVLATTVPSSINPFLYRAAILAPGHHILSTRSR